MTFEELLYRQLLSDMDLKDALASYGNPPIPVIFYQSAPGDHAEGWNESQYPRIDYGVDFQANPERQTSGNLALNIWCDEKGPTPEELEPIVRSCLTGVFLQPENQPPYCLAWARSDAFESPASKNRSGQIIGITTSFDVYAFPLQQTSDPDPILAINEYLKTWQPGLTIIGRDGLPEIYTPTAECPAIYCRLKDIKLERETNTVAWMTGTMIGHIFAPSTAVRLQLLKAVVDKIALDGEILMLDGSPMFIRSIAADSTAHELAVGQLKMEVSWGILRRFGFAHNMANAGYVLT